MLHTLIKHDLKALQAFVAIVECQGISAAQERLNMSQSTISTHLAHLEESLGVSLCQRGRSGFALTKAGHQLYDACTLLLHATAEFHRDVQNIKWHRSVLSGTLRLALSEALPEALNQAISRVIETAYRRYPALRLSFDGGTSEHIETAVANNQVDVGLAYFAQPQKNLHYQTVFNARQNVYCHTNHPARQAENLSPMSLAEDYVWVKRGFVHDGHLSGIRPSQFTATTHTSAGAQLCVLAGSHIGFLAEDDAAAAVYQGRLHTLLPQQATYLLPYSTVTRATPDPRVNWFVGQLGAALL